MSRGAPEYLEIARDILLSPIAFFRRMPITEGIRKPTYFALAVYYLRSAIFFLESYHRGYFFSPRFQAIPPVTIASFIFLACIPFMFLLILYSQSIFLYRIANFFGGTGNLEASYKILSYVLCLSLFGLIPILGQLVHVYAVILLIIGTHEVFNIDWISATLALFFSFVFTIFLYLIFLFAPMYLLRMVNIPLG